MAVTVAVATPSTISGCWGSSWLGKQSPPLAQPFAGGKCALLSLMGYYPPLPGTGLMVFTLLLCTVSSVNCLLLRLCSHPEAPEHSLASITCPLGTPAPRKSCHSYLSVTQITFPSAFPPTHLLLVALSLHRGTICWSKSLRSVKALPTIERSCPAKGLKQSH